MDNKQIIYHSLSMWRNYIQTGDVCISADTAVKMGKLDKCRMLSSDQQEFVIQLEEVMKDVLTGRLRL